MIKSKANYLKLSSIIHTLFLLIGLISAISVNLLALVLGIAGLIAFAQMRKNQVAWRPRATNGTVAGFIFVFYVILSTLWAPDKVIALIQSIQFLAIIISALLLTHYIGYLDIPDTKKMIRAICYGFLAAFILLILETIYAQPIYHFWLNMASARPFDPNHLERSIAVFSLFLFFIIPRINQRTNIIIGSALIMAWLGFCFKFGFITEIIGIIGGLFFLALTVFFKKAIWKIMIALITLHTLLIVPVYMNAHEGGVFEKIIPLKIMHEGALQSRIQSFYATHQLILEKPLFGHGFQSTAIILKTPAQEAEIPYRMYPQNYMLQILFETGYMGGFLFIGFMYFSLRRLEFTQLQTEYFQIGFIACALAMLSFSFNIWQAWWLCSLIFIAICFTLERGEKNISNLTPIKNKRDMRIMHAIFSHGYRGSESALALIANEQIKTHSVSVMVRADCEARGGPSIIDALDPRIKIIRVPNILRIFCANFLILKWQPDVFHAHLGRAVKLKTWLKPNMLRVSSMHIFSPRHHIGQDRIICVSDWQMRAMPENLKLKSRLVRNASPPRALISKTKKESLRKKWGLSSNTHIVGFVGAINDTKGADIAIDAFCQADLKNAHLLMIGEGGMRSHLEKQTAQIENITLTGYLSNARDYMQIIDTLILPSNWAEPFMLSLIEAMAAGCWVITINKYGPGDIMRAQPHGSVVTPNDVQGFAQALKQAPGQIGKRYNYNLKKYVFSDHISAIYKIYEDSLDPLTYKI